MGTQESMMKEGILRETEVDFNKTYYKQEDKY